MKMLIAALLSAAIFWLIKPEQAPVQINNSSPSAITATKADKATVQPAMQRTEAKPVKTEATGETAKVVIETSMPLSKPEPEVPAADIPEQVFCGSPAQRNWKRPVRANVALGREMAAARGWTNSEWLALLELYSCESSWNHMAGNPDSGACGIPQSWPCNKLANAVPDFRENVAGQIAWGFDYIAKRYGNPSAALAKHYAVNWY